MAHVRTPGGDAIIATMMLNASSPHHALRRGASCALAGLLAASGSLSAQARVNPSSASGADATALIKRAQQLDSEGKYDEALAVFGQAAQAAPDLYQPHLGLGVTLDLMGKYDQARQHLAKAIDLAPAEGKAQTLRTMAISYAFTRNPGKAAGFEEQAIDAQKAAHDLNGAAETANELARIYLESGDAANAEKWYRTGYQTGLSMQHLSDTAKDLWEFRWEHAQARIAARRGKKADAQQHVTAAKAILDRGRIPDQARFYPYLTGYVAFYGGDYRAAIADLQRADQKDPFILSLIAQAYERSGDKAQAGDYYRKVLGANAHNPPNAFARPLARQKVAAA